MTHPLTFTELAAIPDRARVVFVDDYDIYPHTIVRAGTVCTVMENGLNEIWASISMLPDDEKVRADLSEWDGCIILTPVNDGIAWEDLSPVALHDTIDSLAVEYAAWNEAQGLKLGSADEHTVDENLTEGQRWWLRNFIERWNAAERKAR